MFIHVPDHTDHGDGFYIHDGNALNVRGTHLTKTLGHAHVFNLVKQWKEFLSTVLIYTFYCPRLNAYKLGDGDGDVENL
jgi:hypothetical protein